MKKLTIPDIIKRKGGEKLTVLTAYDASFARLLEAAGIDMLLVGDSLGNVLLGYESTVPVTMEEMLHHARAVRRGTSAFVVADMPFLSYQISIADAVKNAGRFYKEAGSDAVKLEGGPEVCAAVRAIVTAGMAVMGHIGLTPQTAANLGGYKVQGKDADSARKLLADAKALEEAGVFAIVMECIPDRLAKVITESVSIPTIGIGAGAGCDGQVLVTHDLLGMFDKFVPSFVKGYANLAPQIKDAVSAFKEEVRAGSYPDAKHSFSMQLDVDKLFSDEG
ncbi:MAG: 3-methyl-2-oxobutanoate hydroxymethyltransferase [Proteobacteria bacterium]|nr:3-methyl-2-oxobutanoate hydroxymethyltransferase [Pseudomonadota bacterium]MBU4295092.1 3-methyl-2-oxobutanoate hydroxymethyltransferase [Pseudomonadota bacterium]MCG2746695.1 3-methyl-2-oxobutanoate hydroxymethyltransferase [Desulfobulbaceae bacterium]